MLLAARMVVVTRQTKPMTAEDAAKAEQAWCLRTYDQKTYVEIAELVGYGGAVPGKTAQQAVQRFDAEIEAGQRERPVDPDKKRRRLSEQLVRNVTSRATRPRPLRNAARVQAASLRNAGGRMACSLRNGF